MSNILSVRLENFQSHQDTQLNFNEGLNVVVGQSDSGKTAILRGIRWALFNQPRGTDFLRVGADFVRVTVKLANQTTIIRERTSSKNRYKIQRENEDDLVFEGFGSNVPEEVMAAHHMQPFRIDSDHEWNLQVSQQLEGPFLLEETGSVRAKTIGRMSGAHYLDMAIRDTSKDVLNLSQRVKLKEAEAEEARQALLPFQELDGFKQKLDEGFLLLDQVKEKQRLLHILKKLRERNVEQHTEEKRLREMLERVNLVHEWELRYEQVKQLEAKRTMLKKQHVSWQRLIQDSETCRFWIKNTDQVHESSKLQQRVQHEVNVFKQMQRLQRNRNRLREQQATAIQLQSKTSFLDQFKEEHLLAVKEKVKRKQHMQRLLEQKEEMAGVEKQNRERIERLQQLDHASELARTITGQIEKKASLFTYNKKRTELTKRLQEGRRFIQEYEKKEKQLSAHYQEQLKRLKICPTCGQDIHAGEEHLQK